MATCQMEYYYLAKETGSKQFFDLAHNVNKGLYNASLNELGGMLPTRWSLRTAKTVDCACSPHI